MLKHKTTISFFSPPALTPEHVRLVLSKQLCFEERCRSNGQSVT